MTLELADLIERLDPSAERYVPRLRYYLIHAAKLPLALLEASDSPVADLFRLERSAAWDEMFATVSRVRQHVSPEEESLRHAFEALLERVVLPRLGMATDETPARMSLEEVETMLAERIDEWNRKLAEESLQKGRREGLNEASTRASERAATRAATRAAERERPWPWSVCWRKNSAFFRRGSRSGSPMPSATSSWNGSTAR